MPLAQPRGFVGMQPDMDAVRHARQMLGEIERARRGIGRIAVEHDQRVDRAGGHVGRERGERCCVVVGCDAIGSLYQTVAPALPSCSLIERRERLPLRIEMRADREQRAARDARAVRRTARSSQLLLGVASAPASAKPGKRELRADRLRQQRQAATASQGSRVEATVPVRLGMLSATCSRARPLPGATSPRRFAQAAACSTWCGPGPSRSWSRLTITSHRSSR